MKTNTKSRFLMVGVLSALGGAALFSGGCGSDNGAAAERLRRHGRRRRRFER